MTVDGPKITLQLRFSAAFQLALKGFISCFACNVMEIFFFYRKVERKSAWRSKRIGKVSKAYKYTTQTQTHPGKTVNKESPHLCSYTRMFMPEHVSTCIWVQIYVSVYVFAYVCLWAFDTWRIPLVHDLTYSQALAIKVDSGNVLMAPEYGLCSRWNWDWKR